MAAPVVRERLGTRTPLIVSSGRRCWQREAYVGLVSDLSSPVGVGQAGQLPRGSAGLLLLRCWASDRSVGGSELRAYEHQRRLGILRLGNPPESELGDRAGAKDEAVS